MDASLLLERHPFFFALKVMRDNLQKNSKKCSFCSKMIDFA